MYLFLRQPKENKATSILIKFYINKDNGYFRYQVGKSIHTDNWDFNSTLPKSKRGSEGSELKQLSII